MPGMKFNVTFTFNRFPIKLMHRAIENVGKERYRHILFPAAAGDSLESTREKDDLRFVKFLWNPTVNRISFLWMSTWPCGFERNVFKERVLVG